MAGWRNILRLTSSLARTYTARLMPFERSPLWQSQRQVGGAPSGSRLELLRVAALVAILGSAVRCQGGPHLGLLRGSFNLGGIEGVHRRIQLGL